MSKNYAADGEIQSAIKTVNRIGYISSLLLTVLTAVTWGIAMFTPPISGPFGSGAVTSYPYLNIMDRFPRDYFWMYPAMLLVLVFVVYLVCVDQNASRDRKIFSRIALSLGSLSAGILFVDYFVQISVIQPSLLNGEYDAIALFTQYNPHGLFIALEEAGYLIMSIAILFLTPVFAGSGRTRAALRWTAGLNFAFTILSLGAISIIYGLGREYRFEIAVITFDFLALILLGLFSARLFKSREAA